MRPANPDEYQTVIHVVRPGMWLVCAFSCGAARREHGIVTHNGGRGTCKSASRR